VYCAIKEAACTSLKMLIRSLKGVKRSTKNPLESPHQTLSVLYPAPPAPSPPLPPLHAEELGISDCAIEKAACTSLKMLIRSLKGLSNVGDYATTHLMERSGLKSLWPHFRSSTRHPEREAAAIRAVSARRFLKAPHAWPSGLGPTLAKSG